MLEYFGTTKIFAAHRMQFFAATNGQTGCVVITLDMIFYWFDLS